MKHIFAFAVIGLLTIPAFAMNSTRTSSTTTYETSEPVIDQPAIEQEEYNPTYDNNDLSTNEVENQRLEKQRMEEGGRFNEDAVDYGDRTRTNRERHAINTGSDASDDQ